MIDHATHLANEAHRPLWRMLTASAALGANLFGSVALAWSAPSASLTRPLPDQVFSAPETITIEAIASGGEAPVALVEYFDGVEQTKIGESTTPPYTVTWNGAEPGVYFLVPFVTNTAGDRRYDPRSLTPITVHPLEGPGALAVSGLVGRRRYRFTGADGYRLRGVLPNLPAGLDPTGLRASVGVGGGVSHFELDSRGHSLNPRDADGYRFSLHLHARRNPSTDRIEFAGGDTPFTVETLFNAFESVWADEGVAQGVRKAELEFLVTVGLAGRTYAATVPVRYRTRNGDEGRFDLDPSARRR